MRLSEDRISAIAGKIAFELVKKRYIITAKNLRQVATWVEKPIIEDMAREEEIDAEARRILGTLTKCPPEGSFEYNAMLQKKKEEVARRRGYAL